MKMRSLGLVLLLSLGAMQSPVAQQATRKIDRRPGVPIVDLVRHGEPAIELGPSASPPLTVEQPPDGPLSKWLFDRADVAMLVRADERQSRLSPAGDWIQSDVTVTVIEVFKAPARSQLRAGVRMRFVEEGGELEVNGTRVTAAVPWFRPFERGRSYLMVLGIDPDNGQPYLEGDGVYALANGRFARLSKPRERIDDANEIELDLSDHVITEFRELAATTRR